MHFDFAAFLVIAAFATGVIWLIDALCYKKARDLKNMNRSETDADYLEEPVVTGYARSLFPVILLVLILRSFMYEPFRIPSGSMMPTLLAGDFILVNKFTYGLRIPVTEWKILDLGEPERGDVAVFRFPRNPSLDYIKRVIGLPGDKIAYINKTLAINGRKIEKISGGDYDGEDYELMQPPVSVYSEVVGEHRFDILEQSYKPDLQGVTDVPDGHYFVMGDNRDNSNDSRYWGFVPAGNLVGRADRIWMSWDSEDFRIRSERIGRKID